jgi:hypothetical protein
MKATKTRSLFLVSLFVPAISWASTAVLDSRAQATSQNLSAHSAVITSGYYAAGDGGGATFKNVGAAPLNDTGASFIDAAGNHWQYVPDPVGIHVRQFGAKCDWNLAGDGNRNYAAYDSAAHDDSSAIQNAINFAAPIFANGDDVGGGHGNFVKLPKGACKLGSQLQVKNGVVLRGAGALSSVLVMPQSFPGDQHFILLGDLDNDSGFGHRLEELGLWSVNTNASYNIAMAYSKDTQHTGGFSHVKIQAGNRVAIFMDGGAGGASVYVMEHIETFNTGATNGGNPNPGIILNYAGSLISNLRNIVVQGPSAGTGGSNHVGIRVLGGSVKIDGFHIENIATGIDVHVANGLNGGITRLENLTGGTLCSQLVRIHSFVAINTTVVGMAVPNGCPTTVQNSIPGQPSVTGWIIEDRKF